MLRAELLLWTGGLARFQGRYGRARELYEACLALRPEIGDADTLAAATHNLGIVHYEQGDYTEAARLERESLAHARQVGSGYGVPFGLVSLADVERARGDVAAATVCYRKGLELFRRTGHALGVAQALAGLGHLARDGGKVDDAIRHFSEALDLTAGLPDPGVTADCLEGLAEALAVRRQPARATAFLAAAATMREQTNAPRPPHREPALESLTATLCDELGPDGFDSAWHLGAALAPDEAVERLL